MFMFSTANKLPEMTISAMSTTKVSLNIFKQPVVSYEAYEIHWEVFSLYTVSLSTEENLTTFRTMHF